MSRLDDLLARGEVLAEVCHSAQHARGLLPGMRSVLVELRAINDELEEGWIPEPDYHAVAHPRGSQVPQRFGPG